MNKCDHTIAFFYDYADTRLVTESDYEEVKSGKLWCGNFTIEELEQFNYCPFCGLKLEVKTCF